MLNYLLEINAFYDWLETNPLATSDIALWCALMQIANKAGWPDKFAVAVSVLENKTGLKKDAIKDARNRLMQKGRITWESRKGNQSALYSINPFVAVKPQQTPPHSPPHSPPQSPPQSPPINKLNKTKQNDDRTSEENLLQLVESLTGPLSPISIQTIFAWQSEHVPSLIALEAIKTAIGNRARDPVRYADKVLIEWSEKNLFTIQQVLEHLQAAKNVVPMSKYKRPAAVGEGLPELGGG